MSDWGDLGASIDRLERALDRARDDLSDAERAEVQSQLLALRKRMERTNAGASAALVEGWTAGQFLKLRALFFPGKAGAPKRTKIPDEVFEELDRRCLAPGSELPTTVAAEIAARGRTGGVKTRADYVKQKWDERNLSRRK